jgi:hypothetical protein
MVIFTKASFAEARGMAMVHCTCLTMRDIAGTSKKISSMARELIFTLTRALTLASGPKASIMAPEKFVIKIST